MTGNARLTLALLLFGPFLQPPARADGPAVYRQALPATAWVITAARGKGTGWLLDRSRRLLVTNYHVLGDHETVDVFFPDFHNNEVIVERSYYTDNRAHLKKSGRAVSGKVLRSAKGSDLALIELDAVPDDVPALKLAADQARPGETVHSIGNRRDLDALWVYSTGTVRQVYRTPEGYFWRGFPLAKGAALVVTQSPINEGDSGGPLLNDRGEVVGVVAAIRWQAPLASVAIDVHEVQALAAQVGVKPGIGDTSPPKPVVPRLTGPELYQQTLRSVAWVKTASTQRATGWLLDRPRRLLLTTYKVANRQTDIEVIFPVYQKDKLVAEYGHYRDSLRALRQSGHAVRAHVLSQDAQRNLALLELESLPEGVTEMTLAADSPRPGEAVDAIGNPNGIEALWVHTSGTVRQLFRANLGQTPDPPEPRVVVVQMPLSDGDSGGPLVNERGQLVGVTGGKDAPQQLVSFCIDVTEVQAFIAAARPRWDPRTAAEFQQRGAHYTQSRQYEHVVADYTAALRLDPKAARVFLERGIALLANNEIDRAGNDFTEAIRLDPRLAPAHAHLAVVACRKGDLARALTHCDQAIRIDSKCAAAFSQRTEVYRRRGDLDRALADCKEAIWLDPQLPSAYVQRGLVLTDRGEPDKALPDFTEAIRLDAFYSPAYRARANHHLRKGDLEKAVADYVEAIRAQGPIAGEVLQEIMTRGAELRVGGQSDWAGAGELYQGVLRAITPLYELRADVSRLIQSGLANAERETDPQKRAHALREVIEQVRAKSTSKSLKRQTE